MNYRDIINKLKSLRKESVEFVELRQILRNEEIKEIMSEYYDSKFKNKVLKFVQVSFGDGISTICYWPCVVSYEHKDDKIFEIALDRMCKNIGEIYLKIFDKVPPYIHLMSIKEFREMFLKHGYYNVFIDFDLYDSCGIATKKLIKGKYKVLD